MADSNWIDAVAFNDDGLLPAIAQDAETGRVLMVAFMDVAALRETVETGRAVYYSRSRKALWRKGEESGHHQQVQDIQLDCDGDVLLLKVTQAGGIACHTGRNSCFFRSLIGGQWVESEPVIKDPDTIYDRN